MSLSRVRLRELLRKELRQTFRDPRLLRVMFISPLVQLVVFGYAVNTDIRNSATFVVDQDHTAESRRLVETLVASGYFRIAGRSESPRDLERALDRGKAVLGVAIPARFARDLDAGRGPAVQLLIDGTNSNTGTVARGYATRIVLDFGRRVTAARPRAGGARLEGGAGTRGDAVFGIGGGTDAGTSRVAEGAMPDTQTATAALTTGERPPLEIDLRARAWYNPDLESRVYNVPGVIGNIVMIMCLLLTAMAVVREREAGTLEQLMVSPMRPAELLLAKTLPVAAIALVDLVLISVVAVLWFQVPFRGSPLVLLLAAVLYILAGLSLGLLVSTVSRTQQEAFMSMFMFLLPALILSGFLYPAWTMPRPLQWLALLDPIRHFLTVVRGVFLKGAGMAQFWPQLLTLAAMAAGALTLAILRFRKSLA